MEECIFEGAPFDCCKNAFALLTHAGKCFTIVQPYGNTSLMTTSEIELTVLLRLNLEDVYSNVLFAKLLLNNACGSLYTRFRKSFALVLGFR